MTKQPLLTEYNLNGLKLPNRVVMAPMTRSRADNPENAPREDFEVADAQSGLGRPGEAAHEPVGREAQRIAAVQHLCAWGLPPGAQCLPNVEAIEWQIARCGAARDPTHNCGQPVRHCDVNTRD